MWTSSLKLSSNMWHRSGNNSERLGRTVGAVENWVADPGICHSMHQTNLRLLRGTCCFGTMDQLACVLSFAIYIYHLSSVLSSYLPQPPARPSQDSLTFHKQPTSRQILPGISNRHHVYMRSHRSCKAADHQEDRPAYRPWPLHDDQASPP